MIRFDEITFTEAKTKILPLLDATNSNEICEASGRYSTTLTYAHFGKYMMVVLRNPQVRALINSLN